MTLTPGVRRLLLGVLFACHCALRLTGLDWNIEHHSASATAEIPTYHVDEFNLVEGLRWEFHPFNTASIRTDGPLGNNLTYLALRLDGNVPPEHWDAGRALHVGRWLAALSDCLAFPLLWLLLRMLGIREALALFGVAALVFAPNHVFNSHFARSHMLANLLLLCTVYATARSLTPTSERGGWRWYGAAVIGALLAGATRYPFLSLGLFPAFAGGRLLVKARSQNRLGASLLFGAAATATALALGLGLGFGFHPVAILRSGLRSQSLVGQIPWIDPAAIALSAMQAIRSTLTFPGGGLVALFLLAIPAWWLLPTPRGRREVSALVLLIIAWAFLYLVLWAKFGIPWQRYTMPLSLCVTITGLYALDRLALAMGQRARQTGWQALTCLVAAVLILPGARMSLLVAQRFVHDTNNPHYQLSLELARRRPPTVFIQDFWSWNKRIIQQLLPPGTALKFAMDRSAACRAASTGDLFVDFAIAPLRGSCNGSPLTQVFRLSNLGPSGYPFPADVAQAEWHKRHYEDYHYLFEEIRGFVVGPTNSPLRDATDGAPHSQAGPPTHEP